MGCVRCFCETLAANGGPVLDAREIYLKAILQDVIRIARMPVQTMGVGPIKTFSVYKQQSKEGWMRLSGIDAPELCQSWPIEVRG